jgi:hypothetical protein
VPKPNMSASYLRKHPRPRIRIGDVWTNGTRDPVIVRLFPTDAGWRVQWTDALDEGFLGTSAIRSGKLYGFRFKAPAADASRKIARDGARLCRRLNEIFARRRRGARKPSPNDRPRRVPHPLE